MPVLLRPAVKIPRIGDRCSAWGASSPEDSISLSFSSVSASRETLPRTPWRHRIPWDRQSSWIAAELPQVQGRVANGDDVRRSAIDDARLAK